MDQIYSQLYELYREKSYLEYDDVDEIISRFGLSDEEIDELFIFISSNDLNIKLNEPAPVDDSYFREVSLYPLLTRKEEISLSRLIKQNDPLAKDKFIKANLRLVIEIAGSYQSRYLSFNDLIQEGNIGLLRAVEKYDADKNVPFAVYGGYWIRKYISEAIHRASVVALPGRIQRQLGVLNQAEEALRTSLEREASDEEISKYLKISVKRVKELKRYRYSISSLDEIHEGRDYAVLDTADDDPFMEERIYQLLNQCSKRDKEILESYYGLNGGKVMNMSEIADKYHLTKQRISQIIRDNIRYIRENYDK